MSFRPPPHPDWLAHELTVTGPAATLADFRAAAAGAGVVPWVFDYDELEENWFHLLMAPGPVRGDISAAGARILARRLREAVWEAHEQAVSWVGVSRACPFDLHALVPVPFEILRRGPDDARSLAWLWENWGTTWSLRHVELLPSTAPSLRCRFFSADWTPWRALETIRARWPALRFGLRIGY